MTQIQTVSAKDAITTFHYLYEYSPELYSRETTELTVEEYITYQMALTVPKPGGGQWVRIDEPFIVFEFQGKLYLSSGNSRMQTITRMINGGSKEEFADIRYVVLDKWNDEELMRLQYATNDLTRKNSRLRKLRQIATYINRLVESGENITVARKSAQIKFSVSATDIKNAFLLSGDVLPVIEKMLNDGLIKTDPAIELINIHKSLDVSPEIVVSDLIKENLPLSLPNIKKWRSHHTTTDNQTATVYGEPDESVKCGLEVTGKVKQVKRGKLAIAKNSNPSIQTDSNTEMVELGNLQLSTESSTLDDAKKIAYVLADLIENNRLADKGDFIKEGLIALMTGLYDLKLPEDVQVAISDSLYFD